MNTQPVPLVQRVRASEARAIAAGAARIPRGMLPADAAAALDKLLAQGYASSKAAVIARALVAAADRW